MGTGSLVTCLIINLDINTVKKGMRTLLMNPTYFFGCRRLAAVVTSGSCSDASVATGSIEKTTYVVTSGNIGPGSGSISEPATDSGDILELLSLTRGLEGSD